MDASSMPGSLIWNPNDCTGFTAMPILPGGNATRVCGLQTQDDTLGKCCSNVQTYSCWKYCATDTEYTDLADCLRKASPSNSSSNVFCQSATNTTVKQETKSSAATRTGSTSTSTVILVLCLFAFFFTPGSAEIIPSLSKSKIARRADSSTCQYKEERHYISTGKSIKVTSDFGTGFGQPFEGDIDTGITNNNRTINGNSAAEEQYDAFFDLLSNQTGRQFPALSSIQTHLETTATGTDFFVQFTPYQWCTNGTATGCEGVLGDGNGTMAVLACGPVFVLDNNSTEPQSAEELEGATIQGTLGTVVIV